MKCPYLRITLAYLQTYSINPRIYKKNNGENQKKRIEQPYAIRTDAATVNVFDLYRTVLVAVDAAAGRGRGAPRRRWLALRHDDALQGLGLATERSFAVAPDRSSATACPGRCCRRRRRRGYQSRHILLYR